jgi:hypothetical protein
MPTPRPASVGRRRAAVVVLGFVACAAGGVVAACAVADIIAETPGAADGSSDSGSTPSDGGNDCDASLQNDRINCGACGNACPTGEICSLGQCQECAAPQEFCDAGCIDLSNDLQNCGACGALCQAPSGGIGQSQGASPVCAQGSCYFTCADAGAEGGGPLAKCATGCFDLMTSPLNCGSCGQSCGATQGGDGGLETDECVSGTCGGYVVSNPTVTFLDACSLPGHRSVLADVGDWTATGAIPLSFAFSFFGTTQTEVWLQSQGALGFGQPSTVTPPDGYPCVARCKGICGDPSDDPALNYPAAVAFGDYALSTSSDGVCYAQVGGGDAGSLGQFVVTWSHALDTVDPGSVLTFSIALTQGTNTVDFMYVIGQNADGGGEDGGDPLAEEAQAHATVGIQGGFSVYTPISCKQPFIPSSHYDIRFTPVH